MSQPKSITAQMGSAGVQVEYVKTRGVLRFRVAPPAGDAARGSDDGAMPLPTLGRAVRRGEEVELTVSEFRSSLGIEDQDLASPVVYLLFGGRRLVPEGGTGDLLGSWASETEARAAFRRCREDQRWLWAELATVGEGRTCERVSWFGMDRQGPGVEIRAVSQPGVTASPGRIRRLLRSNRTSA